MTSRRRAALLAAAAAPFLLAAAPAAASAAAAVQDSGGRVVLDPPAGGAAAQRLNPTGRAVTLAVTARLDRATLGEVMVTIDAQDRLSFDTARLLDLLAPVLEEAALRTLRANAGAKTLTPADLAASGVSVRYDPQALELVVEVAPDRRLARAITLSRLDDRRVGAYVAPAKTSAYLNLRGNFDYLHGGADSGFAAPTIFLDGAARMFGGLVAESEAIWQPGSRAADFNRLGSRLVFDDQERLIRWTAGDLQTISRGFQSAPDIAGLSIFRSYSVLQPQRIARPRGSRGFRLDRPATVQIEANGQLLQRLQLQPGNYDLRDFPFAQGANDVRLTILDDAGRTETVRFNLFLDQSQLASGLTEFGLYAGVLAPPGERGPDYRGDPAATGFFRYGLNDALTVGINAQADERTQMAGAEAVWATPLGLFSGNLAASRSDGFGTGLAGTLTFQRLIQRSGGRSDTLTLFADARTASFTAIGDGAPLNPFIVEAGGAYSHSFGERVYAGVDGRYSVARAPGADAFNLRGTVGLRLSRNLNFNADLSWQGDERGCRLGAFFSVTLRLDRKSSVRADYDTRFDRARLSYSTLSGQGVGSYGLAADLERSEFGSGANVSGTYYHNRAELGLSHYGSFSGDFGNSVSQRSSVRVATAFAFADGAVSWGRPINDSFAIVSAHRNLRGENLLIERGPFGYTASTGMLGSAIQPSLNAYIERVVGIEAPAAAAGVDLGQGTFRLLPPYRGGYKLQVGSDYSVTAVGRLLGVDEQPISLLTGSATELAHPERPPVAIFTNRDGRFGASGLAPGRWRIVMNDDRKSRFLLDIPADAQNIVRAGALKPLEGE
ncbi:MAG TPA: fimbrial biogenesis outer membrane usher protein [Allosphingosinicella sp.]|jgi:outer membrane usher protein